MSPNPLAQKYGRFYNAAPAVVLDAILDIINSPVGLAKLETAAFYNKPGVESLSELFRAAIPAQYLTPQVKCFIGYAAKEALLPLGYEQGARGACHNPKSIFKSATRYSLPT